jgi:hypothetical protein
MAQQPRQLFTEVVRAMEASSWKFSVDVQNKTIFAVTPCDWAWIVLMVLVDERREVITARVRMERNCTDSLRPGLAAWCAQKNWALKFGFFICDQTDGETMFRDSVDVEGVSVTPKFIDNMLRRTVSTVATTYCELQQLLALRDH